MFNYDQAVRACREHRFLVGSQISKGFRITGMIEEVIVAPLDGISQYRFLKEYKQSRNAEQALQVYKGDLYTVLLIGSSPGNRKDIITIELDRFLAGQVQAV